MRIAAACTGVVAVLLGVSNALAQEQDEAERVVEAFFENKNYAAAEASSKCPGDDALSDAVMLALTRPRPEDEMRRLVNAWGYVPECRVDQILDWSVQASRIISNASYAGSLARKVLSVDSVQGLRLLRNAATDPSVPHEARGAYQRAVYYKLSLADQTDLYIETFRGDLQAGLYPHVGLQYVFRGPEPSRTAVRILSAVLERPELDQAGYILAAVLSSVVNLDGFGPQDRQRIWDLMEPRLESLPPEMRSAIESYEADLKAGRS
jgi:hypothetical protein